MSRNNDLLLRFAHEHTPPVESAILFDALRPFLPVYSSISHGGRSAVCEVLGTYKLLLSRASRVKPRVWKIGIDRDDRRGKLWLAAARNDYRARLFEYTREKHHNFTYRFRRGQRSTIRGCPAVHAIRPGSRHRRCCNSLYNSAIDDISASFHVPRYRFSCPASSCNSNNGNRSTPAATLLLALQQKVHEFSIKRMPGSLALFHSRARIRSLSRSSRLLSSSCFISLFTGSQVSRLARLAPNESNWKRTLLLSVPTALYASVT